MGFELDHLFVCVAPDAPEAERLAAMGFCEGAPNQHPGQGTACRRFSFANAMIELFWVSDEAEVQNERTRRTLLWKRWAGRKGAASPFGICFRPDSSGDTRPPFPGWRYEPEYLAHPLAMHIGEADVQEPMWVFMDFLSRVHREERFRPHANGAREITGLTLWTPIPFRSVASQKVLESGILVARDGTDALLQIELDGSRRGEVIDLRPELPLVFAA